MMSGTAAEIEHGRREFVEIDDEDFTQCELRRLPSAQSQVAHHSYGFIVLFQHRTTAICRFLHAARRGSSMMAPLRYWCS